jgi:hypothetical protein
LPKLGFAGIGARLDLRRVQAEVSKSTVEAATADIVFVSRVTVLR